MDLQASADFKTTGARLISISPDTIDQWRMALRTMNKEAPLLSDEAPLLSDAGNEVAAKYGVMRWRVGNEPGHTFVVVDSAGVVRSVRDYGAPENGGLMYVAVSEVVDFVRSDLGMP